LKGSLELLQKAWETRQAHFPPKLFVDYPSQTLPISVTGKYCALNCAHCGGHYLASMKTVEEAHRYLDSATSLLISGGCDHNGKVPILAKLGGIKALAPGRRLNWHVGLISEDEALAIAPFVHVISFDFVGDDRVIERVYKLKKTVRDYVETYRMLRKHFRVIPHITIGLDGGRIGHERKALEILAEEGAEGLIFIVFIPTPGTEYALRPPPPVEEVASILAEARLLFPRTPIALGCMRPRGDYRRKLDPLAIMAGINRIVNPSKEGIQKAIELGLSLERTSECCALDL
jgi:uncharacterized radical SAM superfamily protein